MLPHLQPHLTSQGEKDRAGTGDVIRKKQGHTRRGSKVGGRSNLGEEDGICKGEKQWAAITGLGGNDKDVILELSEGNLKSVNRVSSTRTEGTHQFVLL